jgi:putative transposase
LHAERRWPRTRNPFADSPGGRKYPQAARVREDAWDTFIPFLGFAPPVRKLLYTSQRHREPELPAPQRHQSAQPPPQRRRVVKLLWLAIINIEDKRARERFACRATGKRTEQPA